MKTWNVWVKGNDSPYEFEAADGNLNTDFLVFDGEYGEVIAAFPYNAVLAAIATETTP